MKFASAKVATVVSAFGLCLMGAAVAAETDTMEAMRANCGADYLRLCAGMTPDGPEVKACFKRNRPNLSPGCSQAIVAYERGKAEGSEE